MLALARTSRNHLSLGVLMAALCVGCGQSAGSATGPANATVSGALSAEWNVTVSGETGSYLQGTVAVTVENGSSIPPASPLLLCYVFIEGDALRTGKFTDADTGFSCRLDSPRGDESWGFGAEYANTGRGTFSLVVASVGSAATHSYTDSWGGAQHAEWETFWNAMHGTLTTTLPPLAVNTSTADVTVDVVF
jgi:hypothetical protein